MTEKTAGRRAYFLGVGGIGMSALAQWTAAEGWEVSGSDRAASDVTEALSRQGIVVTIAEAPSLPERLDLLVYSDAVPAAHPARAAARQRGIPEQSYAQLLGALANRGRVVAIAGSHGKSSTTALVGLLLEAAGLDPTVLVGTRVPAGTKWKMEHGAWSMAVGNYRRGRRDLVVVEADEYRRHFLQLHPTVAVVTSVDYDHVDAFPTREDYEDAFGKFLARGASAGSTISPADDKAVARLVRQYARGARFTYGIAETKDAADVVATPPSVRDHAQHFRLFVGGQDWGTFQIGVPGTHMVANTAAAVATAAVVVSPNFRSLPQQSSEVFGQVLASFRGTWRRFEHVGTYNGVPIISDYAHHPTELRALAGAARQWYPDRRLVIAFQPHQRARTKAFERDFIEALKLFDAVVLAEVYDVAGREETAKVSTAGCVSSLAAAAKSAFYAPTLPEVDQTLQRLAHPGDVILVVGAGDIDAVARRLARGRT